MKTLIEKDSFTYIRRLIRVVNKALLNGTPVYVNLHRWGQRDLRQ